MPTKRTGRPSSRTIATTIPPFAVPSSLVSTIPVTPAVAVNSRACVEAVLAGGGVHHEEDVVRRAGNYFRGRAAHFFEFGHEIRFRVQTSGGVHDDGVGVARARGGKRVENDGRGIGARLLVNQFGVRALGPDGELLGGGGAKSVARGEDHFLSLLVQAIRQFADGGGFAGAVDADDEEHLRLAIRRRGGATGAVARRGGHSAQNCDELRFDCGLHGVAIAQRVAFELHADGVEHVARRAHAEIGGEERIFEAGERRGIDLLFASENILDARGELRPRLRNRLLQPVEERTFTFVFSEKGDHECRGASAPDE